MVKRTRLVRRRNRFITGPVEATRAQLRDRALFLKCRFSLGVMRGAHGCRLASTQCDFGISVADEFSR
jgi:hypothetical protein